MSGYMRKRRAAAVRHSWALRASVAREREGWRTLASCIGTDVFHEGAWHEVCVARALCAGCPVRMDCLAACHRAESQIATRYWFGTYGGLTAKDRRLSHTLESAAVFTEPGETPK